MPPFNHAFGLLAEGDLGMVRLGIAPNRTAPMCVQMKKVLIFKARIPYDSKGETFA